MGTVTKKPGPVRTTTAAVIDTEAIANTGESVEMAIQSTLAHFAKTRPKVVPQSFLRVRLILGHLLKRLERLATAFDEWLETHHKVGGQFEGGKIAITFPESTARRPKWKEEAVKLGKELANLRGEPFSEEAFCAQIQAGYEATTSTSVKLVESA